MNFILENKQKADFLLERDLFDFVDNLENFQSRKKKKKEYLGKKAHIKELRTLDRDKLILIAYRRNNDKISSEYRQQYFKMLNRYEKNRLIEEIICFDKTQKK
ncbi:hypothetical protein DSAG12_02940 [Promethearchaeum syntrophicum]|uniref:Uncharacterized protein n=1 Tax=Promethearchaeum syntrophicum TaxID=2594042 RepID=A0A5B9DD09_9ARCH|nr:hypothetical protein [Candidatus Prometheoarchaeum syntrophicum]QEE17108.1 hypothetical protein DSAG12_02940 [Candidatus Prometheoarchaeum syntrophicum]